VAGPAVPRESADRLYGIIAGSDGRPERTQPGFGARGRGTGAGKHRPDQHAGDRGEVSSAPTRATCRALLVFLGTGATLAVAVHCAVQCLRAARADFPCGRHGSGRDPAVQRAVQADRARSDATLDTRAGFFVLIVAAGTARGVVAIQIGINFYYLPVALSAKAVGTVLLPRCRARHWEKRSSLSARLTIVGFPGLGLSPFRHRSRCCCSARPIAQSIAFGEMRRGHGIALLSAAIASLGLAFDRREPCSSSRSKRVTRGTTCRTADRLRRDGCDRVDGRADLRGGVPRSRGARRSGSYVTFGELARSIVSDLARARVHDASDRHACKGSFVMPARRDHHRSRRVARPRRATPRGWPHGAIAASGSVWARA